MDHLDVANEVLSHFVKSPLFVNICVHLSYICPIDGVRLGHIKDEINEAALNPAGKLNYPIFKSDVLAF